MHMDFSKVWETCKLKKNAQGKFARQEQKKPLFLISRYNNRIHRHWNLKKIVAYFSSVQNPLPVSEPIPTFPTSGNADQLQVPYIKHLHN